MAESLVSFLVEELASVVLQEVKQEVRLVVGVRKEVEKLTRTFKVIQTVLNDAEQRQMNDESVKLWLKEFKNVAYDMEDVLDEWRTEILRLRMEGGDDDSSKQIIRKKVSSYLCFPFSCFNKLSLRHDIGSRIKEIRENLDSIETEKGRYQFIPNTKTIFDSKRQKTSSIIVDPDILGRDFEKKIILDKLLGVESSAKDRKNETTDSRIISIIGMGGLGKTTLAKLIFNDNKVKAHFEKTMWVCVSDAFDLTVIAKTIIQEATQNITSLSSEWNNALHQELCNSIKGKQFLLVLDDVWTEDPNNWNPLKHLLNVGAQGSRILVTTRNESVASMINSYKYFLGDLSFENCCLILCRKAFFGRKKEVSDAIKEISIEIAKKCSGLPLAANILGSLLSKKITEKDWRNVLESTIWELKGFDKKKLFNPALLLSYDELESPLKRCFEYCAIFPKDHEIEKQILIEMWMAQGVLNSREMKDFQLESVGEDYFNDLAALSFFQDFSMGDDGSIIHCKMHDLIHDFAQFLTKNECYVEHNNDTVFNNNLGVSRHLTLVNDEGELKPSSFNASLRTLNVLSSNRKSSLREVLSDLFHHLRCLRVLSLTRMDIVISVW